MLYMKPMKPMTTRKSTKSTNVGAATAVRKTARKKPVEAVVWLRGAAEVLPRGMLVTG